MDTQNTPIHIHLWHRDFWLLAIANMILTLSVYMMIPEMDFYTSLNLFSPLGRGIIMGAFGIGLFIPGPFVNYFIQKYRRNRVCLLAIIVLIVVELLTVYVQARAQQIGAYTLYALILLRILLGASFGLAQMVMTSTLVIDLCESFQRTEANHALSWFGRFALSLGPLSAYIVFNVFGNVSRIVDIAVIAACASAVLISRVSFPFKTPDDEIRTVSTDRFFLPQGKWLFANLFLITAIVGIVLTMRMSALFYGMMMAGFFLALLAEKFAFADADLRSETVTGLIAMIAALLILLSDDRMAILFLSPILFGFGIGIIGSRFLLFFIKLARHCQRGTSQSSFFLSWESGIAAGLFAGCAFLDGRQSVALICGVAIAAIALIFYNLVVHSWYVRHKNR